MMEALQKYDMNLMRIFVMIYETRSVTETANLLIISQPSVSFALSKLRNVFADPLFRRGPKGLEATALANSLYPELQQAIRAMDSVVQGMSEFEPATTRHKFRLMMTDLGVMALFPFILRAIQEAAPRARIQVDPLDTSLLRDRLMRNEADAAIGVPAVHDGDLVRDQLMDMPYVGICAADHPRMSRSPSLEEVAAERHIVISNALGNEHVPLRLFEVGIHDSITVSLPHFAALDQTVAATEFVAVVPRALADIFESHGSIKQFPLPFTVAPGRVGLYTYKRTVPSPPIQWLRRIVSQALMEYPSPKSPIVEARE